VRNDPFNERISGREIDTVTKITLQQFSRRRATITDKLTSFHRRASGGNSGE
jgi:hypothetical protein